MMTRILSAYDRDISEVRSRRVGLTDYSIMTVARDKSLNIDLTGAQYPS